MAVERIGAPTEITSNAAASSTTIAVPYNCTYIVVGVTGWDGTANYHSGGTITLNSVNLSVIADADADNTLPMATLWGLARPATGAQTLAWDWSGASAPDEGMILIVAYLKGVHPSTPIRSSAGAQIIVGGLPVSTGLLLAQQEDYLLVQGSYYANDGGSSNWSSNVTEIHGSAQFNFDKGAMADTSPTGAITVTFGSNPYGAAIAAAVFIPSPDRPRGVGRLLCTHFK